MQHSMWVHGRVVGERQEVLAQDPSMRVCPHNMSGDPGTFVLNPGFIFGGCPEDGQSMIAKETWLG